MTFHERLLRLALDGYKVDALLGDLEEEAARLGAPPRWLQRQALLFAASSAWMAARHKRIRMLTTLRLSFRDARRSIYRSRATSLAAALILSLSMAAGAVTFAVVDTIVLRPLPYTGSERLVSIAATSPKQPRGPLAVVDYFAWKESSSSFSALSAWRQWPFELSDDRGSQPVTMVISTASLFDVLQTRPQFGTLFTEENETPGRDNVALISHELWQRRYGADPTVLGTSLKTPTGPVTIIGVMPPRFAFPVEAPAPPAIWRPLAIAPEDRVLKPEGGRASYLQVLGRLEDGVSIERTRSDVERVFASQRAAHPSLYNDSDVRADFLLDALTARVGGWMRLVLAAVAMLMAIGCVNVSNLLLTRAAQRTKDVSIRLSLGASRAQVMASLLAESLLLATTAAAAGLLAAYWLLALVKAALPAGIVRAETVQLDARVFAACAVAGLVTALVAGLVPGWQAGRVVPAQVMKDGAIGTANVARRRWQAALLVAQVALVTVMVVAATLLVGSFVKVMNTELGFSRHNLAGVSLGPTFPKGPGQAEAVRNFYSRAEEAVRAVPGVQSVAMLAGGQLPLYSGFSTTRLSSPDSSAAPVQADIRRVSESYFDTAGIRIVEGRPIGKADEGQLVAVIDQLAARHLFEGRSAVGQRVLKEGLTVVGVASNVKLLGPEGQAQPQIYRPFAPVDSYRTILIRTSTPVKEVAPAIAATLTGVAAGIVPTVTVKIVDDQFRILTADRRFNAGVMSALGLLALLIAASGIYATTASMVAQRTKEIGIRMALGASAARLVRAVTTATARLLLAGAAVGVVMAWGASSVLASVVFGITPNSPSAYLLPLAIVAAGGLVAAALPALSAARIDPLRALRSE